MSIMKPGKSVQGTCQAIHDANVAPPAGPLYLEPKRSSRAAGRINLRAVSEVLQARGLDPTEALIDILDSGKLDPDVQARILNELLQYTQPKLKSIEVRAKVMAGSFDVNDDQARKIAEEFLRGTVYGPTLPEILADTTLE